MSLPAEKPRIAVLVGPTGVGKSALALRLASHRGAEIVSADSMQVYCCMDIGTAKPSAADRAAVPHHLLDLVRPDQPFNAALYREHARQVISDLHRRGKPILVVGGTGLYVKVLLGGLVDGPGPDEALRHHYRDLLERRGREFLHDLLTRRDPRAAAAVRPTDAVRVIRALEVLDQTGRSIVDIRADHRFSDRPYDSLQIGLAMERPDLFAAIDRRVDAMLGAGLVEETERLLAMGFGEELRPMQALGYRQIVDFLCCRSSLPEAVEKMRRETKAFAKRQGTWFRADTGIRWFTPGQEEAVEAEVSQFWGVP
ncbi:MAG: tRNA (adenosine(37)-N6)-dimethylallyltransferase MiaA [Syntrophaceae bacterium]|nr:tRNA (adenosine(37)-N6)-dimethylallyltransferase MiaA [Syntrophaceae bacterium]